MGEGQNDPSYHELDDNGEMKIAMIPYSELRMFKYKNAKQEIIDQILKKNEWIREDAFDTTVSLEHKYFTVYYDHV